MNATRYPTRPLVPDQYERDDDPAPSARRHPIAIATTTIGADPCLAVTRYAPTGTGRTASVPLVLIHGAAHSQQIFAEWACGFAERGITCYTLDLRGHGASTMPAGQTVRQARLAAYVADLRTLAITEPALADGFVLLGHSLGGLIAQCYAQAYRVRGLIVLASTSPQRFLRAALAPLVKYPAISWAVLCRGSRAMFDTPRKVRQLLLEADAPHDAVSAILDQIGDESQVWFREGVQLARAGIPPLQTSALLFIGGGRDAIFPPKVVRRSAADYGAPVIMLADAPHDLMLAKPPAREEGGDHVAEFVYRVAAQSTLPLKGGS